MDDVPAAEIAEWESFEREFGPITLHERIDTAAAIIGYAVSLTVPRKPGHERPRLEDFLPRWERIADDEPVREGPARAPARQQTPEEMIAIARRIVGRARGVTDGN